MDNKTRPWCITMGVIGYILGVSLATTLILIPLAVYCFIGANKYMEWSNLSDSQLAGQKQSVTNWCIFFSIVGFPIGLFSIIPVCLLDNNVSVTNVENENKSETVVTNVEQEAPKKEPVKDELSDLETIEKLNNLKEEGLITEEEYQKAKQEVLDKNN